MQGDAPLKIFSPNISLTLAMINGTVFYQPLLINFQIFLETSHGPCFRKLGSPDPIPQGGHLNILYTGGPSAVSQTHLKVSNKISQAQKYQLNIFDETQIYKKYGCLMDRKSLIFTDVERNPNNL